ncbi:MAG: hypothetical protein HRU20_11195 [Pseudomonadales bacterium]|nr:hypothetical protein [Pseudomonadales bacterium]
MHAFHVKTSTHIFLLVLVLVFLLFSSSGIAATYSDGFENNNVTTVADFTVVDDGISLSFTGGTAFRIGNGSLYHSGLKSWMLEPASSNSRGTHPGMGMVMSDTDIGTVSFWIIADSSQMSAVVSLLDINGNAVENFSPFMGLSTSWQQVSFTITAGSFPIRKVSVAVMGTGMLAVDDIIATSVVSADASDSGSADANDSDANDSASDSNGSDSAYGGSSATNDSAGSSSGGTVPVSLLIFLILLACCYTLTKIIQSRSDDGHLKAIKIKPDMPE